MKNSCIICNSKFFCRAKTAKFCSKRCSNKFTREKLKTEYECYGCHKKRIGRKDQIKPQHLCPSCSRIKACTKMHQSGSKNPAWRGGHRYWQQGKFGKDKEGLSWKKQRQLAWERDKHTCQDCDNVPTRRRPDVHHIKPFRNSHSHALENLITLCQKCHKKRDAKETTLWNGETFGYFGRKPRPACIDCKTKIRKLDINGRCLRCKRKNFDIPLAKELFNNGKSMIDWENIKRFKNSNFSLAKRKLL